jgi:chaperone modulatory protein CbpM
MRVELTEVQWMSAEQRLPLHEFTQLSGLLESELQQLVEYGVIAPLDPHAQAWIFSADCLPLAKTAVRLRRDFDLQGQGLAVALTLIERVQELETRLRELHAQLPGAHF